MTTEEPLDHCDLCDIKWCRGGDLCQGKRFQSLGKEEPLDSQINTIIRGIIILAMKESQNLVVQTGEIQASANPRIKALIQKENQKARIEELKKIDSEEARVQWLPSLDNPDQEIKWVAVEDIKKYVTKRIAELESLNNE